MEPFTHPNLSDSPSDGNNSPTASKPLPETAPQPAAPAPGPIVVPEAYTVNPGSSAAGGKKFPKKPLLAGLLAVLVLLGGSAAAYFGYYLPNKPENVLAKSLQNTLAEHQLTTTGTLNITTAGLSSKVEYAIGINEDSHATDSKIKMTISGVDIPLETVTANGNVYFKVGDLSTLEGIANQFIGSSDSDIKNLEDKINQTITNQWISVDSTLVKEAKLDCLTAYPKPFTQADIQALVSSYNASRFSAISSHGMDNVNGKSVKYDLKINDNQLAGYKLASVPYFKDLQSCLQKADPSTKLDLGGSKDGDTTPITIWVDKSSKRVVKYASQSTKKDKNNGVEGDITGTVAYGSVNINAPANAKPVLSLLNQLGLSGLFNSLGSSGLGSGDDTERKTDIKAMQGHLEAYWADNAKYPTLADLNNPAFVAANFKGLDAQALQDPAGTSQKIAAAPAPHVYAYQVTPAGCDNVKTQCVNYTLTATLSDGSHFTVQSNN